MMRIVGARKFRAGLNGSKQSVITVGKRQVAQVAEAVYVNTLLYSKVLTGLSRSNWRFSIGRPDGAEYDPNGVQSIGQSLVGLEHAELVSVKDDILKGSYTLNKTVWLSNPVDYAVSLEFGSQGRAGVMMLQRGISTALSQVKDQVFVGRVVGGGTT